MTTTYSFKILYCLLFMSCIFLSCGLNEHKDLSKVEPAYEVTVQELLTAFETDEEEANKKYAGEVIEWKGTIKDIVVSEHETTLYFGIEGYLGGVSAEMDPSKLVVEPSVGETITVRGICSGKLIDVVISRCIIVQG